jgi:hypothetical protein
MHLCSCHKNDESPSRLLHRLAALSLGLPNQVNAQDTKGTVEMWEGTVRQIYIDKPLVGATPKDTWYRILPRVRLASRCGASRSEI